MARIGEWALLEFRILGPLEVVEQQQRVVLGGLKQRALVAILLLHRGEVVSSDRLIDELWGERPPATAAKTLQAYVSRLRKALGSEVLVTRNGGYALAASPSQLDADRFEGMAADARRALADGDAAGARELLGSALALWRGEALADLAYEPFAQAEIARLEERRLGAVEDRIDAELMLGQHRELLGELEALVARHPRRERLLAQLMVALYRSGRQADALDVYHRARRALDAELGLDPGPELRALEQRILTHDPALDPPTRRPRVRSTSSQRAQGRLLLLGGGALLFAAAVAAGILSLAGGAGISVQATANSVAVIDPNTNRVVAQTSVGAAPGSIAAGLGGVWVANTDDHTISQIDPTSYKVVHTRSFGSTVDGVAADSGSVWTVDSTRGVAARVDPTFGTVLATVGVGDRPGLGTSPNAVAVSGGVAWVANDASQVVRIADGGAGVTRIDVGNAPSGIAVGEGATWVADNTDGTVSRIDSAGVVSEVIPVGPGASGIAVGDGAVWVADPLADSLVRIDPSTDSTTTIRVGSRPRSVAWGDRSVWVANSGGGTVSRVDPGTDRVIATIRVGQSPQALVATAGAVLVTVAARPAVQASPSGSPPGVLRVARNSPFGSTDPAVEAGNNPDVQEQQLLYETCAGLLSYPDRPAPEGTRLVPEVARSMPTVSADGRTYTFVVRPGFRFSPPSGAPVTAATFKHTIERTLNPRLGSPMSSFMGDIVGMRAYQARRTAHLAGVTATGDRLQIRLIAREPNLPTRLATMWFCAVPGDTPITPQSQPIPSAGPYYIIPSSTRDQLVLARNPNYHGHRPRIPRQIVYSSGVTLATAVREVQSGHSDYVNSEWFSDKPAAAPVLQPLEARYGADSLVARTGHPRYFINPWMDVEYFLFNTARPLFASARLRRAVNYAIDRRALVEHHFPFNGGRATDHYLPPGIPGSHPVDIYPLGGPDLAKARSLARGVEAHATMYTCDWAVQCIEGAQILANNLKAIGITLEIKQLANTELFSRLARPGEPWDIAFSNYAADFPDPADMINTLFDPASPTNFGRFNDPAFTRRMRQAATLSGERRFRAFARLDEDLTRDDPPAAAWGNGTLREFFSARVGCQVYQPIYGFDLGTICLRP